MGGRPAGAGMAHEQARGTAALIVSAYEGALVQARVAGNVMTMSDASEALVGLLRLSLGRRNAPEA